MKNLEGAYMLDRVKLGDVTVQLSASVTNLGAVFDKKCRMEEDATRVCRSAKYYQHLIRRIRLPELQQHQVASALTSYVTSGL